MLRLFSKLFETKPRPEFDERIHKTCDECGGSGIDFIAGNCFDCEGNGFVNKARPELWKEKLNK